MQGDREEHKFEIILSSAFKNVIYSYLQKLRKLLHQWGEETALCSATMYH